MGSNFPHDDAGWIYQCSKIGVLGCFAVNHVIVQYIDHPVILAVVRHSYTSQGQRISCRCSDGGKIGDGQNVRTNSLVHWSHMFQIHTDLFEQRVFYKRWPSKGFLELEPVKVSSQNSNLQQSVTNNRFSGFILAY